MIAIRDRAGKVISSSRNLRGIMRHASKPRKREARLSMAMPRTPSVKYMARKLDVVSVRVLGLDDGGALLRVRWSNGDHANARFASCTTARRWVQARRAWPGAAYYPPHGWTSQL